MGAVAECEGTDFGACAVSVMCYGLINGLVDGWFADWRGINGNHPWS